MVDGDTEGVLFVVLLRVVLDVPQELDAVAKVAPKGDKSCCRVSSSAGGGGAGGDDTGFNAECLKDGMG